MKKSLCIVLIIATYWNVYGQWLQLPGLSGANIEALHQADKMCFAATDSQLFFTKTESMQWKAIPIADSITGIVPIRNFRYLPPYLYVRLDERLYRSRFNGTSWNSFDTLDNKRIRSVERVGNRIYGLDEHFIPVDKDHSYKLGVIYQLQENSIKWEKIAQYKTSVYTNEDIIINYTGSLHNINNRLFISGDTIRYLDDQQNIQKVNMAGLTTSKRLYLCGTSTGMLFLYGYDTLSMRDQLFRYSGSIWTRMDIGISTDETFQNLFAVNDILYCSTRSIVQGRIALYRSLTQGASWQKGILSGLDYFILSDIVSFDSDTIMVGSSRGVHLSGDFGDTFITKSDGLYYTSHSNIISVGSSLLTPLSGRRIMRSSNKGQSWEPVNPFVQIGNQIIFAVGTYAYIDHHLQGFYRSADEGATWELVNHTATNGSLDVIGFNQSSSLFTYDYFDRKYYRSTDNGTLFTNITGKIPDTNVIRYLDFAIKGNGDRLFYYKAKKLYTSTDNGETWSTATEGLPDFSSTDNTLALTANGHFYFIIRKASFKKVSSKIYRFNSQWEPLADLPYFIRDLSFFNNILYAVTDTLGVLTSTDNGITWQPFNDGFEKISNMNITALAFLDNEVYASTLGNGVWKTKALVTTGSSNLNRQTTFTLYPNPSNGSFSIQTHLQSFSVDVMDSYGLKIWKGENPQSINLSAYPSGIYFYQVSENGKQLAKGKMVKK